jgi:hypothetical protein
MMHRSTALIVAFVVSTMVGCRPAVAPPRAAGPQPAPHQPPAPQQAAGPAPAPAPPPVLEKTHFVFASVHLKPGPVVLLKVDGLPPDPLYGGLYQFVEVSDVHGAPPPAGPCYLIWGGVDRKDGSFYGGSGDPINGPFVEKQLGAGTRLTNVTPIGSFKAKSKGFLGRGIGDTTAPSSMEYTLFEATVQR